MNHEMYEAKKNFITRELLRMLQAACPEVKLLEYRIDSDRTDFEEIVTIRFIDGYVKRVDVTADGLLACARDVLGALD